MGLMTGTGPLGRGPAGKFNPEQTLYLEPTPKRLRVVVGDETVADSRGAFMLHEQGLQPVYYFPSRDVHSELLEPSDRVTRCPKKGEASYWTIRAGETVVDAGAWYYPEPLAGAGFLRDLVAFYFDRMDHWYEENEEIYVHPRDPYHRVDVVASDRVVRVSLDGSVLAESSRALALFETGLPTRWYVPREDVVASLEPSDTLTRCPYKGEAGYYSAGGVKDLVWYYAEPFSEVGRIAGLLCFFNEKVDLSLDGSEVERPVTAWSRGGHSKPPAHAARR
jgi:uncharacterized protein (DUF427 family)